MNLARDAFAPANLRRAMGHRDVGETILARVSDIDGGSVLNVDGNGDVWVSYQCATHDHPGTAVLHIPGNILWAVPDDGDSVVVLRGRETNGPGVEWMLHGNTGAWGQGPLAERVPSWATTSTPKDGLYTTRSLRLESKNLDVEIVPEAGHKVYVGAPSGGGTQPAVLGNDNNAYLAQMRDKINALEDLVGDLIAKYNGHGHVVSGTATGTPMPPETGSPPAHVTDPPALASNVEVK